MQKKHELQVSQLVCSIAVTSFMSCSILAVVSVEDEAAVVVLSEVEVEVEVELTVVVELAVDELVELIVELAVVALVELMVDEVVELVAAELVVDVVDGLSVVGLSVVGLSVVGLSVEGLSVVVGHAGQTAHKGQSGMCPESYNLVWDGYQFSLNDSPMTAGLFSARVRVRWRRTSIKLCSMFSVSPRSVRFLVESDRLLSVSPMSHRSSLRNTLVMSTRR